MKHTSISILSLLLALLLLLSACNSSVNTVDTTTDGAVTTAPPLSDDCLGHADSNDDGRCDSCLGSVLATVDFYAINDLHGKFADTDAQPGVDELTTYLKTSAAADDHAVFLSSGDMWQGSSESNLTEGRIVTDWMSDMGFVSMTLGNHEFDWGEAPIEQNAAAASFPFLAINIYDRETNARVDYVDASVMVERGGAQIGIIGAIGDCYSSISTDKVEDVYFKTGSDLTALVKAEAERLRAAGADFIVYSLHDGYGSSSSGESFATDNKLASYYSPVLSDGVVDLVFEAHTHQRYTMVDT
ncbi:MAG: metallophosphoesterase, partial [Clostridia bacterium]|nr:metallophosphoesterase [Clostridia bacterium]